MEKVSELREPPTIGKFYLVECIRLRPGNRNGVHREWVPVIGAKHNDPEVFIKRQHYHPDPRFMHLTYKSPVTPSKITPEEAELGMVFFENDDVFDPPILKKLKCRRQMPIFPSGLVNAMVLTMQLERIYVGRKTLCGKCPHKKMPLESLPRDQKGNVICNGHGLKIHMPTKTVVKRFESSEIHKNESFESFLKKRL